MGRRQRHESLAMGQTIRKLHDEGKTATQIAEKTQLSLSTVYAYIHGFIGTVSDDPDPEVVLALANTHNRRDIARILKTTPHKVHMVLAEASLTAAQKKESN